MVFSPRILAEKIQKSGLDPKKVEALVRKEHGLAFVIADVLHAQSRPGPEALYALAKILGCKMEEFLEERDDG